MKFISTNWNAFSAKIEALYSMLTFIKKKALVCDLPLEKIKKIELASEEALTNIIQHGQLSINDSYILIKCVQKEDFFEVLIKDKGIYFNPSINVPNLQETTPLEKRIPGGLGIFLMKKCIDQSHYIRLEPYNILSLKIKNT